MAKSALLNILQDSRYTTVLSGYEMLFESHYPSLRDGEESFDIEQKYGYTPEEILTSSFYNSRTEQFFEFYREVMLGAVDIPPGSGFTDMAELERRGLFQTIITRRLFGVPERAGCKNVINLHGSIYNNCCPHCGRKYSIDYIRNSPKVPLCETCGAVVRPQITLFGEMVDNQVITRAAEEISRADVLLVLGTNLSASLCSQLVKYYEGNKLVLVHPEYHFSERLADVVFHQRVDETLQQLRKELED